MKIISIILISAAIVWLCKNESIETQKRTQEPMAVNGSLQRPHFLNLHKPGNKLPNLADLENELKKFKDLNYDDLNQEQLNTYNQLVLLRAEILKKQIFSKAVQMGYRL